MEVSCNNSCDATVSPALKNPHAKGTTRHDMMMPHEPFLSLSLSGPTHQSANELSHRKTSHVERQRDYLQEEETTARKKLRIKPDQLAILETTFSLGSTLNSKQKHDLARKLNLKPRQVEVWFQNRRARTKFKQEQVNLEFLREYFRVIASENQTLKKEIEELKTEFSCLRAYKCSAVTNNTVAGAATNSLKICPSCNRIRVHLATQN